MVNDWKQSSISGGQGALLRSDLTLPVSSREKEMSFWVCGGNPQKIEVVNTHHQRTQEGFYHADCHPLHTLPVEGHICLRHSHLHVALRVSIPSDGVELAPLHWCLRRSHKPSKTLNQPQTHFWGLPWKTETHLNLSLYYSTDLFVLWVSPTPNGSRLQSSLRQDSDHHSQYTILVAGSMGGGIFLLLFFLSFPLYIFQRDIFIVLCCYITIANNNQNGYIPAFYCNQIFSKINPTYMYL